MDRPEWTTLSLSRLSALLCCRMRNNATSEGVEGLRQPSTLNPQPLTLDRHSAHNMHHSTLSTQYSTLNTQTSTINTQHSTLNTQHSTRNTQHSTLNTRCRFGTGSLECEAEDAEHCDLWRTQGVRLPPGRSGSLFHSLSHSHTLSLSPSLSLSFTHTHTHTPCLSPLLPKR